MFEQCLPALNTACSPVQRRPCLDTACSFLTVIIQTSWRSSVCHCPVQLCLSARDIVFEMTRPPPWQLHTSEQFIETHCMLYCCMYYTVGGRDAHKLMRECYWFCKTIQVYKDVQREEKGPEGPHPGAGSIRSWRPSLHSPLHLMLQPQHNILYMT